MIIDCHCHAGQGDGFTGPWDTSASLGRYLERADEAGIGRSVLFSTFHSDYAVANRNVARIVAGNRKRFVGFAFVHAAKDRARMLELVGRAVHRYGFRGIKVHRYDAPINRAVCDAARFYQIPVLYDPMGEVSVAELLGVEYPDVDFIIPHLGSFADDWKAQQAFIDPLARYPNLHTDTSGIRRFDLLQQALDRAGPAKILFGSDGPWLHPGLELAKVVALKLSQSERELILAGNLIRLISRTVRARPHHSHRPDPFESPIPAFVRDDTWTLPGQTHP
jgi:predicted TIM-barrel fold metal-dependent hydrolase